MRVSVLSLLRPLRLSLSLSLRRFSRSALSSSFLFVFDRLIHPLRQSLPVVVVHPSPLAVTFSRSVPLPPTAAGVYNDSSWWDDTGSEVRTAEPDVHSMESLSSSGTAVLRGGYTRPHVAHSPRARGKSAPSEQRPPAPAFARTRLAREQLAWKALDFSGRGALYESAALRGKLIV